MCFEFPSLLDYYRSFDVVQSREIRFQIGIASIEKRPLLAASNAAAGTFAVLRVQGVGDVHVTNNPAKGHKGLGIVRGCIVPQIDEDLRGPAIRHRESVGDSSPRVRFAARVVGNRLLAPQFRDSRLAVDSELRPASLDHPEEASLVIVACANEAVKAVRAIRRPGPLNLHYDDAFAGFQIDKETIRRPAVHLGRFGTEEM